MELKSKSVGVLSSVIIWIISFVKIGQLEENFKTKTSYVNIGQLEEFQDKDKFCKIGQLEENFKTKTIFMKIC